MNEIIFIDPRYLGAQQGIYMANFLDQTSSVEGVKPKETMKNRKTSKSPVGISPGRVNDCIELAKEEQLLSDEWHELLKEDGNLFLQDRRAKKEGLHGMYKWEMERVKKQREEVGVRLRAIRRKQKVFNCP